jgi:hypothetical protein
VRLGQYGAAFTVDLLAQAVMFTLRRQIGHFTDLAELDACEDGLACAIWFCLVTVEKTVEVTIFFFE